MSNTYLIHYGVKGMHWGVRRYQNYDGSLKNSAKRLGNYYKTKATGELKSMGSIGKNIGDAVTGKDSVKKAFKDTKSDISKNSQKTQKAYNTLSKGEKAVTHMVTAATMLIPVGGIGANALTKSVKAKNLNVALATGNYNVNEAIKSAQAITKGVLKTKLPNEISAKASYSIPADAIIKRSVDEAANMNLIKSAKNIRKFKKSGLDINYRYSGVVASKVKR